MTGRRFYLFVLSLMMLCCSCGITIKIRTDTYSQDGSTVLMYHPDSLTKDGPKANEPEETSSTQADSGSVFYKGLSEEYLGGWASDGNPPYSIIVNEDTASGYRIDIWRYETNLIAFHWKGTGEYNPQTGEVDFQGICNKEEYRRDGLWKKEVFLKRTKGRLVMNGTDCLLWYEEVETKAIALYRNQG